MSLITHTKPQLIAKRTDGLNEYRYTLSGLVDAVCTTFCKNLTEAIKKAKQDIKKYMERSEYTAMLRVRDAAVNNINQEKVDSGWTGIVYMPAVKRWRALSHDFKYIGQYTRKDTAVTYRKKSNLAAGLPEFHGKKK